MKTSENKDLTLTELHILYPSCSTKRELLLLKDARIQAIEWAESHSDNKVLACRRKDVSLDGYDKKTILRMIRNGEERMARERGITWEEMKRRDKETNKSIPPHLLEYYRNYYREHQEEMRAKRKEYWHANKERERDRLRMYKQRRKLEQQNIGSDE